MSRRVCLSSLTLLVTLGSAVAQQPSPAPPVKADSQSSRPHVRLGGIFVDAGYSRHSGYGYYPGVWGYRSYLFDPFLFSPFARGFATGFAYQPNMGEVKIQSSPANALVYIDGALAGRAGHLKSMWLDPGVYHFAVHDGARKYAQRVYVLTGKTLKLTPELMEQQP
jgi:hypothetical protein